jgi:MOSC domain-containing protein YiiM
LTTGIFKEPVEGRIRLKTLNLDGDRQADLTVHGGPDKAVYAYSVEHYDYWHRVFIATQPRMPCYKLGVKFGRMDVIKRFLASGRSGIYFKVSKEGEVSADDTIEQNTKDPNRITISDIVRLYSIEREDLQTMRRAVKVDALPKGWKTYFLEQIKRLEKKFAR